MVALSLIWLLMGNNLNTTHDYFDSIRKIGDLVT